MSGEADGLKAIWLVQPLAFARGGGSDTPCDAFDWAGPDLRAHGTGRTQIRPAKTLTIDPGTGEISLKKASDEIIFKDAVGIRPVCPFFELHGRWVQAGTKKCGPVTSDVLALNQKTARDLTWRIAFSNAKAFHWTRNIADRVDAGPIEVNGEDCRPIELKGCSPPNQAQPLVPYGISIPLGKVQLSRPNADFPEFRLRFTPGKGLAYGPTNFNTRLDDLRQNLPAYPEFPLLEPLLKVNRQWDAIRLPPGQCILNPEASWPQHLFLSLQNEIVPDLATALPILGRLLTLVDVDASELMRELAGPKKDVRNLPPGLYANITQGDGVMISLGMIDDFGDGMITCRLTGLDEPARARVISTPPDFAPDRRPIVSVADGLADRVLRLSVRAQANAAGCDYTREVRDLLDRAFETMGLANLDAMNDFLRIENAQQALRPGNPYTVDQAKALLWQPRPPTEISPLPLTAAARDRHRRNTVAIFIRALVQGNARFMEHYIREPGGPERLYDRKMPGLMRGADRMPLHITRRQYDMLKAWVASLQLENDP